MVTGSMQQLVVTSLLRYAGPSERQTMMMDWLLQCVLPLCGCRLPTREDDMERAMVTPTTQTRGEHSRSIPNEGGLIELCVRRQATAL